MKARTFSSGWSPQNGRRFEPERADVWRATAMERYRTKRDDESQHASLEPPDGGRMMRQEMLQAPSKDGRSRTYRTLLRS